MEEVKEVERSKINNKCSCGKALFNKRRKNYYIVVDGEMVFCEEATCYKCNQIQPVPVIFSNKEDANHRKFVVVSMGLKPGEQWIGMEPK